MASGYGEGTRTTGRGAEIAVGVLMLGSTWAGVAAAETTTTTPPTTTTTSAASTGPGSAPCLAATGQLGQATAALQALPLDPTGTLKTAVDAATAAAATACAAVPATDGGTTTTTAPGAARLAPAGAAAATGADRDCPDFTSQPQAQAYFTSIGGSAARNADRLDRNRNGIACEDYPYAAAAAPLSSLPAGVFGQVSRVPVGGIETGGSDTP